VRHMILGPSHGFNDPCRAPPARRWSLAQGRQAGTHAAQPRPGGRPGARRDVGTWPFKAGPAGWTEDARARRAAAVRTNNSWRRNRSRRGIYGKSACRVFEWRVATRAESLPAAALPRPLAWPVCPAATATAAAPGPSGLPERQAGPHSRWVVGSLRRL
jgi:hypothetical protein